MAKCTCSQGPTGSKVPMCPAEECEGKGGGAVKAGAAVAAGTLGYLYRSDISRVAKEVGGKISKAVGRML